MKKLLFVLFYSLYTFGLSAQVDPAAKELLNRVSKKYEQYKTIQSDFSLSIKNAGGDSFHNKGTMLFDKPKNQYRIKLQEEDILSDGTSVWSISNETKEVQVTVADNSSSAIGPTNLFTFYKSGYKYVGMPDEKITKNGKSETVKVVELSPLDTKTNYFKIKLRINNNTHIHDVTIYDKSSNRFTYVINNLFVNHKLSPNNFKFNKENYSGFEVVDLR